MNGVGQPIRVHHSCRLLLLPAPPAAPAAAAAAASGAGGGGASAGAISQTVNRCLPFGWAPAHNTRVHACPRVVNYL